MTGIRKLVERESGRPSKWECARLQRLSWGRREDDNQTGSKITSTN